VKIGDIISQIAGVLPKYTDYFSDTVNATFSYSGGTVTAITDSAHGLKTGKYVTVTDAVFPTSIASITRVGNVATVITNTNHDLTEVYNETVNISGSDQSDYNGDHTLLSVTNRKTFTFSVSGAPTTPATGTMLLNEDRQGYNGRHQVTVTSTTQFTYPISNVPNAGSSGKVKSNIRISGGITYERIFDSYTVQNENELYCFVVPQPSIISKNRSVINDATDQISASTTKQIKEIENFAVFVFVPSKDISGRIAYDLMEDVARSLYRSLIGVKLPTYLSDTRYSGITLTGHGHYAYHKSLYVHAFEFQSVRDITMLDMANLDESVAFRDIDLNTLNDFGETITSVTVDLDEASL